MELREEDSQVGTVELRNTSSFGDSRHVTVQLSKGNHNVMLSLAQFTGFLCFLRMEWQGVRLGGGAEPSPANCASLVKLCC